MISSLKASHLNRYLVQGQLRTMSTASIKSRFETAYEERMKNLAKVGAKK